MNWRRRNREPEKEQAPQNEEIVEVAEIAVVEEKAKPKKKMAGRFKTMADAEKRAKEIGGKVQEFKSKKTKKIGYLVIT